MREIGNKIALDANDIVSLLKTDSEFAKCIEIGILKQALQNKLNLTIESYQQCKQRLEELEKCSTA